jgi:hypothetical protein
MFDLRQARLSDIVRMLGDPPRRHLFEIVGTLTKALLINRDPLGFHDLGKERLLHGSVPLPA